jgi:hypothetical protein
MDGHYEGAVAIHGDALQCLDDSDCSGRVETCKRSDQAKSPYTLTLACDAMLPSINTWQLSITEYPYCTLGSLTHLKWARPEISLEARG